MGMAQRGTMARPFVVRLQLLKSAWPVSSTHTFSSTAQGTRAASSSPGYSVMLSVFT